MYIPASFAETDQDTLHSFIEQHSFGLLVTHDGAEPTATHIPFLLDRDAGTHGCLIGHVARANPQWKTLEDASPLVVFSGPHAYISPTWFEAQNTVPTWNYTAVHVYGQARLITDDAGLLQIVRRTVDVYESGLPEPWSLDRPDPDFVHGLLGSIVGFEIPIDRIEGKWKLNQNHDEQRREKVIHQLRDTGIPANCDVADLMSRV